MLQKMLTSLIFLYGLISTAIAEPQLPSKSYLPPQGGYNYNAPNVPFPSPSPSTSNYYTAPSYKPQSTQRPRPSPIYTTPSYSSPQQTYGPPSQPYDQAGSQYSGSQIGAGTGGGEFDHLRQPHVPGMPYDFSYSVKDDYYGTNFAHSANSNGDQVKGEYRVLLPDSRLQIVRYVADWKDGYTADVSYEGEAKYPESNIGASGSSISGGGIGGYQYPNPSGKPFNSNYSPSKPNAGYSGSGYQGSQQSSYSSSPSLGGYPSSQQSISGYGSSQQAAGGYSSDYGNNYN